MTATDWRWPGARWWRCDLHVHTPASSDFDKRTSISWQDWVAAVAASGVDVVAVTDHNTAAGVGAVQAAARGAPFVVLPGVELTVHPGVHLLALFDPATDRDAVAALLGRCEVPPERFGDPNAVSPKSVIDAMAAIAEADGLCIAAHGDHKKGILQVLPRGQSLLDVVRSPSSPPSR